MKLQVAFAPSSLPPDDRIFCAARAGGTDWLGTAAGIKSARKGQKPRLFGVGDGVPAGAVVAIAADSATIVAAVQTGKDQIALCIGDAVSGRFRAAGTVTVDQSPPPGVSAPPALVALGPRDVWLIASSTRREQETIGLRAARSGGASISLGWDRTLRADHGRLPVFSATSDGDRLWLGTELGLCALDGQSWRRMLPDRTVGGVVVYRGALYCVAQTHSRRASGTFGRLERRIVDTRGRVDAAQLLPAPPAPDSRFGPTTFALPRAACAADGALWWSALGDEGLAAKRGLPIATAFLRHAPSTGGWTIIERAHLEQVPDEATFPLLWNQFGDDAWRFTRFPHWRSK